MHTVNTYKLIPGDRLLVIKGSVILHSSTYMGRGLVAHISPEKDLIVETLAKFADGRELHIRANGGVAESLLWRRFEIFKKNSKYCPFTNNCEHLCNFLETGMRVSPQLQGGVAGFSFGCAAVRALKIGNGLAALGMVLISTLVGINVGAPKPGSIARL